MLFHSTQLFYIISSEDRKEPLPHSPCLWHFFPLLSLTGQGRTSVVSVWGVQAVMRGCCDLKGCSHLLLSDKDPEHLCQGLSEASRKDSENDAANQRKTNPPSPTPNQPELCPGPLFHSCCWRCWRAGRNNSFSESQDQGPHIPISKSEELKRTGWDFIGIEYGVVPNGSDAQDYLERSLWEKDLVILMESSSVWARKTYAIILRPP